MSERWAKLDVGYLTHPKVAALQPATKLLHVASILWTAAHLTDGYVPATTLRTLSESVPIAPRWRSHHASQLVEAGLWDVVPEPRSGWVVHDYAVHNRAATREIVEQSRAATRERVRRLRARASGLQIVE